MYQGSLLIRYKLRIISLAHLNINLVSIFMYNIIQNKVRIILVQNLVFSHWAHSNCYLASSHKFGVLAPLQHSWIVQRSFLKGFQPLLLLVRCVITLLLGQKRGLLATCQRCGFYITLQLTVNKGSSLLVKGVTSKLLYSLLLTRAPRYLLKVWLINYCTT